MKGWIVLFAPILETDVKVTNNIYLRIKENADIKPGVISYWFSRAIEDLQTEISREILSERVCYEIKSISFSHTDFQEEGLYYAMLGWLAKRYSIELPDSNAFYSEKDNKYIFPALKRFLPFKK